METPDEPLPIVLFEYNGADLILCSHDSRHFRVPKSYIINSSPVLDQLIRRALASPGDAHTETSLPMVQLPESGAIIHSLLTFIFPVTPLVPPTAEKAMELLSVAQKYQMGSIITYIRFHIARKHPASTDRDTALHIYSLAQKYGLYQEALQAARTISKFPMSIGNLEDKLDIMPAASLYELWKYYEKVRAILTSDLTEFRTSRARDSLANLRCSQSSSSSSQIPPWIDDYITSIGDAPSLFDLIEFNSALARHMINMAASYGSYNGSNRCACASMSSQTMRSFWDALTFVFNGSFEAAESALSLVQERENSQSQLDPLTAQTEPLDVPDADLIIRSSDHANFRVHKPILAMASPVFKDLLSLPQPSDSESIDGLPMVQLSEDAELLNILVSMLYPVCPATPKSYEKVLDLLAAAQKYEMAFVLSFIRTEVERGDFPTPVGTGAFRAYAVACNKGLIPEMEYAARLTLDHPMTFETLGESLRLFEGWALRDLARFRKRCRETLMKCLESFLEAKNPGPSTIWTGCPDLARGRNSWDHTPQATLPNWLRQVLSRTDNDLFTHSLTTPSNIREKYLKGIQTHSNCNFCLLVHTTKGSTFCVELESKLAEARDKESVMPPMAVAQS